MELKLQKQPVAVCELLLDTVAEYPIECDLLLPDYCPDIVRVLCCRVQASCSDCSARKSTLTVEGMAAVSLCYIGEVGGMRKAEYKIPFSKSFELSREVTQPICSVTIEPGADQLPRRFEAPPRSARRADAAGAALRRRRTARHFSGRGAGSPASAAGISGRTARGPVEPSFFPRGTARDRGRQGTGHRSRADRLPARGAGLPPGRRTRGAQRGSSWFTCSIRPTPKPALWKAATIPCRSASSSRCPASPKKPGAKRRWPAFRPNAASTNLKRGSGWRCSWPLSCAVFPPSYSPERSTAFRPSIRPRTPSKACGFRAGPSRLQNGFPSAARRRCPKGRSRCSMSGCAGRHVGPKRGRCPDPHRGQLTFTMLTQGGGAGT